MTTLPRDTDGKLSSYAWPGGYLIHYLDRENSVLCPDCANNSDNEEEVPQFRPVSCDVNYEDIWCQCDQCSVWIDPAYMTSEEAQAARMAQGEDN